MWQQRTKAGFISSIFQRSLSQKSRNQDDTEGSEGTSEGFFKRTVQNKKKYVCAESQECRIDKNQRKRCASCRFQKCLRVGMLLEAVRANRMRGGRNKFNTIYKQDRALKQKRKALIQVSGFRLDNSPPLISLTHQRVFNSTGVVQPDSILHSSSLLQAAQNDYHAPSLCSLHSNSASATQHPHQYQCQYQHQYQYLSFTNWTIKSKNSNNYETSPGSAAGICPNSDELCSSPQHGPRVPQLVMEFLLCDPDELQLQNKIADRLQQEQVNWRKQATPSTFSLMCLMANQMLFSIVEWARTSIFFKQLKVSDQMKLLNSCWCELLLLDVISRQVLYGKEGSLLLVTGQEMQLSDVASHGGPSLATLVQRGQQLVEKLRVLKVDRQEFVCIKFLILFNPIVKDLEEHQLIERVQEQTKAALLEYTLYTSHQCLGRFTHLLLCLSELRSLSSLAEDYLYCRHVSGEVPCNNLLTEMLHAKRSDA